MNARVPNGEGLPWQIEEQIVEDPVSGLTFQFEVAPDGKCHLRIFGDVPFGNREFVFDNGTITAAGCLVNCHTKPAWKMQIEL